MHPWGWRNRCKRCGRGRPDGIGRLSTNQSLSSYGYLPGRLFPLLPFFGALPLPRCAVVTFGPFPFFRPVSIPDPPERSTKPYLDPMARKPYGAPQPLRCSLHVPPGCPVPPTPTPCTSRRPWPRTRQRRERAKRLLVLAAVTRRAEADGRAANAAPVLRPCVCWARHAAAAAAAGLMSLLYILLAVVWLLLAAMHWRELLYMQSVPLPLSRLGIPLSVRVGFSAEGLASRV